MNATTLRFLGFGLPIVLLATALHVEKDPGWGAWLDGLLSGGWFAGLFALPAVLKARFGHCDHRVPWDRAALELASGAVAGLLCWSLLWLAWRIPGAEQFVKWAFVLNSLVFLAAGATAVYLPTARRPASA